MSTVQTLFITSVLLFFFQMVTSATQLRAQEEVYTIIEAPRKIRKAYDAISRLKDLGRNANALEKIEALVNKAPGCIDLWLEKAELNYRLKRPRAAISDLERVIRMDPGFRPDTYYDLGRIHLELENIPEARKVFEKYLQLPEATAAKKARAEELLEDMLIMEKILANPVRFYPERLPTQINSRYDEVLPAFSVDGAEMIFTRKISGQEDLYRIPFDTGAGKWGTPEPISEINSPDNEGAHTISADGKTMIFTACNRREGYGSCDLYLVAYKKGQWTSPQNLGPPVNTAAWESQPSLSSDGKTLCFASNRKGGKGGNDIWVTKRNPDGSWTVPENIPGKINTSGNEASPFLHADGATLYFMSDGHPGLGGYDIFMSRKIDDMWSQPLNLGVPLNTTGHEGALVVHPNGRDAFFSTNRSFDGNVENLQDLDIYRFVLNPEFRPTPVSYVNISVHDVKSGQGVQAVLEIFDPARDTVLIRKQTDPNGIALIPLPNGHDYGLHVSTAGYQFYSDQFVLSTEKDQMAIRLDVPLRQIALSEEVREEAPTVLENIYFESGSAALKASSAFELGKLYAFLKSNARVRMEIRGHTDNIGTPEDNLRLSQARAEAVVAWLVQKGIDPGRLRSRGFGESLPLNNNQTEAARAKNRRTEFVIIPLEGW